VSEFKEYAAHGWQLCAIDRGRKGPVYDAWNTKPIPADAVEALDGAGLLHALSGTCALDVDAIEPARAWLAERGVDLDGLLEAPEAVRINSGRPGRAKLLYKLTRPLRTIKPTGSGLELRCATADGKSVQDVLPPSIHPDTKKPYAWAYGEELTGHWSNPPPIPPSLLALWRQAITEAPVERTAPIAPTAPRPTVDLQKLRKAAFRHSADCEYDEWLKVGMQLHEGTGGMQEGLDIWCEWSKGFKRKPYPGDAVLKAHYLSFSSGPGKHVATGAALVAELPADAEEFPIEDVAAAAKADIEGTAAQLRQVAKEIEKRAVGKLEERLVYVYGEERYFDCDRHKVIGSDNAIEHMFTHLMPSGKQGKKNPVTMLKQSATKRYVDSLGFHPGEKVIFTSGHDSYANLYRNRLPEPIEPTSAELEKIAWIFERIDDAAYRSWLLQFYGHVAQRPGVKIKSAPLIWSDTQGNGKTTLVRMLPSLLVGAQYSREVNTGLLHSDFNDYLLNAWHINLTEFRAGTKGERESISKKVENWIADDTVAIHPKGKPGYSMPNHFFITGSSNADDAAAVSNQDRKWAIHELHAPQFTVEEQQWLYHEFLLLPRAAAVLRHYFLNVDLTGFVASAKAPHTEARQEMIDASVSSDLELLELAFEERTGLFARDVVLTQQVKEFVHKHSPMKPSVHRIGKILCRAPFNGKSIQFRVGEGRYRGIVLRNKAQWTHASGQNIMSHIDGEDVDITA
jgi:hypothetical protein